MHGDLVSHCQLVRPPCPIERASPNHQSLRFTPLLREAVLDFLCFVLNFLMVRQNEETRFGPQRPSLPWVASTGGTLISLPAKLLSCAEVGGCMADAGVGYEGNLSRCIQVTLATSAPRQEVSFSQRGSLE